jgi:hypothetical protein
VEAETLCPHRSGGVSSRGLTTALQAREEQDAEAGKGRGAECNGWISGGSKRAAGGSGEEKEMEVKGKRMTDDV